MFDEMQICEAAMPPVPTTQDVLELSTVAPAQRELQMEAVR